MYNEGVERRYYPPNVEEENNLRGLIESGLLGKTQKSVTDTGLFLGFNESFSGLEISNGDERCLRINPVGQGRFNIGGKTVTEKQFQKVLGKSLVKRFTGQGNK